MLNTKTFAVVGGDARNVYLANLLAAKEKDYKVYGMFLEKETVPLCGVHLSNDIKLALPQSNVVIFPLPLLDSMGFIHAPLSGSRVTLEECLDCISPETTVLGGKLSGESLGLARRKGIEMVDYLEREEFAILNAVPTAEGAIEIALQELPVTLFGSNCLITGFGRISKVLAGLLRAFGAHVYIAARRFSDLAWIRVNGCQATHISQMDSTLSDMDIVFNTVPSVLFNKERLRLLGRECLLIDLASQPGGVDFDAAKQLGIQTIWALSLPGKTAPISAGEIALDTIFNILTERGVLSWQT